MNKPKTSADEAAGTDLGTNAPAWQRPPFEPGNKAAVKHGAYSGDLIEPRAAELTEATFDANPHLDAVRDQPAVLRYCLALSRAERLHVWLYSQDPEMVVSLARKGGSASGLNPLFATLLAWEKQAERAEAALGISPLARIKAGADAARGELTAEQLAEQRKARERLDKRLDRETS